MEREHWATRIGFLLACAGSAIGLGNIWRFPYLVGTHGGAAFVLVYLLFVVILGIPVMMTEMILGRSAERNPIGTYRTLSTSHSPSVLIGWMGVFTGFVILSYYTGIAGWTLGYIVRSFAGSYWMADVKNIFEQFISEPVETLFWFGVFMFLTVLIVAKGIQKGIEKWNKILMPTLLVILIILLIRSVTLKGAIKGIEFYLKPDFSKLTFSAILAAAGQAFFSLSLGMGIMITYGSYLIKKVNIFTSSVYISLADTLIAFLAGFVVFPAVFSFGLEPSAGPGLTFITIPQVFTMMPLGRFFAILFFILLAVAAITSTVSLLEVLTAFGTDELGLPRKKSTIIMAIICCIIGIFPTLSFGVLKDLKIFGKNIFDTMDFLASNILLLSGGMLSCLFLGWSLGIKKAIEELSQGCNSRIIFLIFGLLVRFISPVVIFIILLTGLEWLSLKASLLFLYLMVFLASFYVYPLIWIGRDARKRNMSAATWRFLFAFFWIIALLFYVAIRQPISESDHKTA